MEFRIGVNLGDVIVEGERIYGDGVNIAVRVEGLAEGGGVSILGFVYEHSTHSKVGTHREVTACFDPIPVFVEKFGE